MLIIYASLSVLFTSSSFDSFVDRYGTGVAVIGCLWCSRGGQSTQSVALDDSNSKICLVLCSQQTSTAPLRRRKSCKIGMRGLSCYRLNISVSSDIFGKEPRILK